MAEMQRKAPTAQPSRFECLAEKLAGSKRFVAVGAVGLLVGLVISGGFGGGHEPSESPDKWVVADRASEVGRAAPDAALRQGGKEGGVASAMGRDPSVGSGVPAGKSAVEEEDAAAAKALDKTTCFFAHGYHAATVERITEATAARIIENHAGKERLKAEAEQVRRVVLLRDGWVAARVRATPPSLEATARGAYAAILRDWAEGHPQETALLGRNLPAEGQILALQERVIDSDDATRRLVEDARFQADLDRRGCARAENAAGHEQPAKKD